MRSILATATALILTFVGASCELATGSGLDPIFPPDGGAPGSTSCQFVPSGKFLPELECSWNQPGPASPYPGLKDVVMTPVVINLTDDNGDGAITLQDTPDVAFVAYARNQAYCPAGAKCGCCNASGVLRVVSGRCGNDGLLPEHFSVGPDEIEADTGIADVWLDNSGGLAAGDIDRDGSPDLVATLLGGGTIAFESDGRVKWIQRAYPDATDHLAGTQPALADLDSDGAVEVIQGRVVLRGTDGSLLWRGHAGIGTNSFLGPVSVVGDVDLDGKDNVIAGSTVYGKDGAVDWTYEYPTPITAANCQSKNFPCDGFTATGNFDGDDRGEIVVVRAGTIYILDNDGRLLVYDGVPVQIPLPVKDCAKNEGGPPTVADFDGDGEAEVGVAGADYYVVADLECLASPLPAQCYAPGIRWVAGNNDCSSRVTGSSVFDFDGDGRAEVVYNDEQSFFIFDGVDGTVRVKQPNASHTRLEMPIVVDVDNDGNAEIVFIENRNDGPTTTGGIRIWGDAEDSWVPTRRIWNQHSYHVTNVGELGEIPTVADPQWLHATDATASGKMNSFRQNLGEFDVFSAPDLTLALTGEASVCPSPVQLQAEVCNEGVLVAGAGIPVYFYHLGDGAAIDCAGGTPTTQGSLDPGQCETVSCAWAAMSAGSTTIRACVDNHGIGCSGGGGGNNECREDNNSAEVVVDVDACEVL